MRMAPQDSIDYPKLVAHISTVLPTFRTNTSVIDAMQKLAGVICKEDIKDALVWGQGPLVKVTDLPTDTLGLFTKGMKSNVIFISRKMVKDFGDGVGKRYFPSGETVEVVTVILLHELTHWADDQDGKDEDPKTEEGQMFEKMIWGRLVR
jgi:hypothetical protein